MRFVLGSWPPFLTSVKTYGLFGSGYFLHGHLTNLTLLCTRNRYTPALSLTPLYVTPGIHPAHWSNKGVTRRTYEPKLISLYYEVEPIYDVVAYPTRTCLVLDRACFMTQ